MGEENDDFGEGIRLITETLITVILVVIYVTSGPILRHKKIKLVQESGVTMIIAILLTLLAKFLYPNSKFFKSFHFNDSFFFTFVLPLIIFSTGYSIRRDLFFKYINYIFLFSITGTFIVFFIISILTYFANARKFFYFTTFSPSNSQNSTEAPLAPQIAIDFSLWEVLFFSAAISASDSISLGTFYDEQDNKEQKLLSIAEGDGLINNAICIALFNIVSNANQKEDAVFTIAIAFKMIYASVLLFILSFFIGTVIGCLCALFLVKLKSFHLNRVQEISILLLFAFISYILADWIYLSPIISILSCGISMSHYTFYNLSFQSREESFSVSKVLEVLASAFAFSFIGLTTVYYTIKASSVGFIIFELIVIFIAKFVSIFIQIWICKYFFPNDFKLKTHKKLMLSFTGIIRGAISFALAISIKSNDENNKQVLISSAILIVFITTVVIGGCMSYIFKMIKSFTGVEVEESKEEKSENEEELYTFLHPNFNSAVEGKKKEKEQKDTNWIDKYWVDLDEGTIKPYLICGWPGVKEDNDTLPKMIKAELMKYKKMKQARVNEIEDDVENENLMSLRKNEQSIEMNFITQSSNKSKLGGNYEEESRLKGLKDSIMFKSDSE